MVALMAMFGAPAEQQGLLPFPILAWNGRKYKSVKGLWQEIFYRPVCGEIIRGHKLVYCIFGGAL